MESPPKQLIAHIVFKVLVTLIILGMLFVPASVFFEYWAAICSVITVGAILSSIVELYYVRKSQRLPTIVSKYETYIKISDHVLGEILAQLHGEEDGLRVKQAYYTALDKMLKDKLNV